MALESITTHGIPELKDLLDILPEHVFKETSSAFKKASLGAQSTIINRFGTENGLNSRTGLLRRSIKVSNKGNTIDTLKSSVFTDVKYAPIQETGGTIRAKNKYTGVPGGPYLNIPLTANKTGAGVMRRDARSIFSTGGFIIKSKAGNYLVMSGEGIPMFVLKKQVTIPARLGMQKAVEEQVPTLLSTLNDTLLKGI